MNRRTGDYSLEAYRKFLREKTCGASEWGLSCELSEVNPWLKMHQKLGVVWGVRGGRRALFEAFGLGKTVQQLEILRLLLSKAGGRGLIVAPLGVRQEFKHDAEQIGIDLRFVRSIEECEETGIYLTNYETVRDGKLDPSKFTATSLDEAAILRGFGGTKTFREFMRLFESVRFRFVATATPDPNEYIELLAYSAYLGIMDVSAAKTRFFKRDSTKADKLTIHPHKEREFWLWVSSWALFVNKPSDLGPECSDEGYALPPLEVIRHEVAVEHSDVTPERDGQGRMFREAMHGVVDAAREKRDTLKERVAETKRILEAEPSENFILWHDLEAERKELEREILDCISVYGAQRSRDSEALENAIATFSMGGIKYLGAKPSMFGAGANFQYHCARAVFVGIGFKFNDFIQAIHRIYRFLQAKPVKIHLVYAESERRILEVLLEKWERYKQQTVKMSAIIQEYGLASGALAEALKRSMGVDRAEVSGKAYRLINNDCVEEIHEQSPTAMESNSVGLILTSIPFSTQYEYSPCYSDFGHTDSNEHFWEQMDFIIPQLLRVLKPGRIAAIHVKDRIVPGGITGLGFQTVYPFHMDAMRRFTEHGFAYIGMKTIVTDVVRENNQTYRLGWTEQCKDGTKMGVGMPEYLMLFRKPPTDSTNAYADEPVVKQKRYHHKEAHAEDGTVTPAHWENVNGYSRARWQVDAHGFERSNGNRPLTPADLDGLTHPEIFKRFKKYSLAHVYDFENHVKIGESLEAKGILPVTFMLLQPQSWSPEVWTDITRMRTLNAAQSAKGKEMHLCPMQFDIASRVIEQMSNPGDIVLDPFGGLGTVAMTAVEKGRFGLSVELSTAYWIDSQIYCKAAQEKLETPTLFDLLEAEPEEVAAE